MEIQKNSRQMPKTEKICSDKKYSDVVYGWFQDVSLRDKDNTRFVDMKDVNFSTIADRVKLTRQTVSRRVKNLEDIGLIQKNEMKKRYEIPTLLNIDASLIPQHTLKFLVDSQSENTISIYVYLLNRYWANNEQPFSFTLSQVKQFLGISSRTTSNNHCITNPLISLKNNGLLNYELKEEGGGIKTVYYINWMSFSVKNLDTENVKKIDTEKVVSA